MGVSKQITRNNHYVPQFYLRLWSKNGNTIQAYNGIIKNEAMRGWRTSSIRSTACWPDFYTDTLDGRDDDKFERLMHDFEDDAKRTIEKLRNGFKLTQEDMHDLVQFAIVQAVRTPSFMLYSQGLLERTLQPALEDVIAKIEREFADGSIHKRDIVIPECEEPDLRAMMMNIEIDEGAAVVKAETCVGRQNFIAIALRFIEGAVGNLLRSCNWVILETSNSLLTSDNPVVFLHFHGYGKWTAGLDEGLITHPTIVYMPLTPNHAMLTQIGCDREEMNLAEMTDELYQILQMGTVMNAKRYVYSTSSNDFVEKWRPQNVNEDDFDLLDDERTSWHKTNIELEDGFGYLTGFGAS